VRACSCGSPGDGENAFFVAIDLPDAREAFADVVGNQGAGRLTCISVKLRGYGGFAVIGQVIEQLVRPVGRVGQDVDFEALTESKRSLVCQIRAFRRRLDCELTILTKASSR
jgi:hypothetical protein